MVFALCKWFDPWISLVTFRWIGTIYQIRLLIKNCQNCSHHEYFLRPYVMWYFLRFLIIHSTMFNPFLEVKCKSYLPKNNPCMMFCQPFHCSIYIFFDSIPPLPSSGVVFREKNSTPWPYSWMSCQPSRLRLMHLGDASFIFRKNADVLGKHPKKHKWSHARCDSHDAMCYSPIQHAPRQSNSHDIKIPPARDPIWRDVIKLPWTSTLPWFLRVVNLLAFPCCISLLLEWRSSWWWLDLAKIHQSHVLW